MTNDTDFEMTFAPGKANRIDAAFDTLFPVPEEGGFEWMEFTSAPDPLGFETSSFG